MNPFRTIPALKEKKKKEALPTSRRIERFSATYATPCTKPRLLFIKKRIESARYLTKRASRDSSSIRSGAMHFGRVLSRVDGMIHSTELVRAARRSIVGNVERARFHGSQFRSSGNHCRFISFPFLPSDPDFFRIWEKFITRTGRNLVKSFKEPLRTEK